MAVPFVARAPRHSALPHPKFASTWRAVFRCTRTAGVLVGGRHFNDKHNVDFLDEKRDESIFHE